MKELISLVYASRAKFSPVPTENGVEPSVARILMQSRQNNTKKDIGGVLYFGDVHFFQVLEGERSTVNETFRRIQSDPRHTQVTVLSLSSIRQRQFARWSMKYIPAEQDVRRFIQAQGYTRFAPLEFSGETVNGLIRLFSQRDEGDAEEKKHARGLRWTRLFHRHKNAAEKER
ncbi:BLUF domain-containing protein [Microbulbifer sp. SAOS-129_SWC]|uniref:BLUF domain-containing protein n=1 Tax=Microbulbifer sp. SAOS-129_SWC TaxID=3145235 RepID=UPI0032170E0B